MIRPHAYYCQKLDKNLANKGIEWYFLEISEQSKSLKTVFHRGFLLIGANLSCVFLSRSVDIIALW